jgi:hypothetical protein
MLYVLFYSIEFIPLWNMLNAPAAAVKAGEPLIAGSEQPCFASRQS